MRRIHTAATCRESTASLNKTDNTESASGKNPHGSEVERIHNSGNNPPALQSLAWTLLHGVQSKATLLMSAKQSQSEQPKQSKVVTCPQIQQSKPKLSHVCKARHGCHMSATRSKTTQLQQHKVVTCPTFKQHNSVTGPQSKAKLSHIREAQLSNSSKAKLTHVGKAGRSRHMSDK